ncbi:dTDP-4-dehydrorhamnose 3,5-epimerase family protein [Patescibacteria group bacterium]|nr:dTDP-4-dehydrorhamnose 3,5-epimerase family protein [Patescibacteria group bacterium]
MTEYIFSKIMSDIIPTSINGLEVHLQKVFGDPRGLLAEMIQGGVNNPVTQPFGIGNIYTSIATGKHIARAAHFHFKNHEIFFTLTGTALWLFHDFREGSPTFGQNAGMVVGFDVPTVPVHHPVYTLDQKQMARVVVPTGVYHAYWPLTDEKVVTVAVASEKHDDVDYDRRTIKTVPGFLDILAEYGVDTSTQP